MILVKISFEIVANKVTLAFDFLAFLSFLFFIQVIVGLIGKGITS